MDGYISRRGAIDYFMANTNWHDEEGREIEDADEKQRLLEGHFNAIPAADVRENIRGEFIGTEADGYADGFPVFCEWKCSACGTIYEDEEPLFNYCPNCGMENVRRAHVKALNRKC